ncbi:unknown [Prevotella sp. CAG:755]|nr:unknown [Prevotella sp. CAG:755]
MPYIRQSLADARQLHAEQRLLDRQRQERLENLGTDMTQGIDDPELQKEIEEICKLP